MAHYVTGPVFQAALVERKKLLETNPDLRISEYIGECILKICTNLSHKSNFNGYSYKEEMISDAIESCLAAVDKYDSEKYSNPFAYFTQCAFYAYLQRLAKEKKQQAIKGRMVQNMINDGSFSLSGEDLPEDFDMGFIATAQSTSFFGGEESKPKKVKAIPVTPLSEFVEE